MTPFELMVLTGLFGIWGHMVPTPPQIEVGEDETGRIQFFCVALS